MDVIDVIMILEALVTMPDDLITQNYALQEDPVKMEKSQKMINNVREALKIAIEGVRISNRLKMWIDSLRESESVEWESERLAEVLEQYIIFEKG